MRRHLRQGAVRGNIGGGIRLNYALTFRTSGLADDAPQTFGFVAKTIHVAGEKMSWQFLGPKPNGFSTDLLA